MAVREVPFSELLSAIVDNRGKTCPISDAGIPLIATNCIRNELLYPTYEKARFVSQETYSNWFRGHPKPGDILFVNKATPGRVCLVPDPVDFCIAQDMVALRADAERVYPRFLFAALRSQIVQERIGTMHVGTLIPHFKKGDFDKLMIPVPDRVSQEFIGDIYYELSAKIDLNQRTNETLEAMARALFKSWFVDFDPVRAKAEGRDPCLPQALVDLFPARLVDSELGESPEGWRVGTVGDLCAAIFSGGTPSTREPTFWDGGIPWLSSGETREKVILYTERTITEAAVTNSSTRLAPAKATVIASAGQGNTRGQTSFLAFDSYINQSVVALVADRSASSPHHLFFDLERRYEEFRRVSDAHSSRGSLTTKLLAGLQVVLPSPALVDHFDDVVDPMVTRVVELRKQSRTIAALRDALLPKLVSGELRVGNAERFSERVGV